MPKKLAWGINRWRAELGMAYEAKRLKGAHTL